MTIHKVQRVSTGTLSPPRVRDDGTLILDGIAATEGIHEYKRNGRLFREYVPADELGNAESIATLARRTVTLEHPVGMKAHPGNYASITIGDMGEESTLGFDAKSASLVFKELFVRAARGIKAVIDKVATEVSLVYTVDLDMTPGEWNGKPYDAIQRNRRYNSIAITRKSRAGSVALLRLDSSFSVEETGMTEEQCKMILAKLDELKGGNGPSDMGEMKELKALVAGMVQEREDAEHEGVSAELALLKTEHAAMKQELEDKIAKVVADLDEMHKKHIAEIKGDSESFIERAAEYNKVISLADRLNADSEELGKCKSLSEIRKLVASKCDGFDESRADSADYQAAVIDLACVQKPVDTRYGGGESRRVRGDSAQYKSAKTYGDNGRFSMGHTSQGRN